MTEAEAHGPSYEPGVAILAIMPWLFPAGGEPGLAVAGTLLIGSGSVAYADLSARLDPPGKTWRALAMGTGAPLLAFAGIVLMLAPGSTSLAAGFVLAMLASAPRLISCWRAAGYPARTWMLVGLAGVVGTVYGRGVHILRVTNDNFSAFLQ